MRWGRWEHVPNLIINLLLLVGEIIVFILDIADNIHLLWTIVVSQKRNKKTPRYTKFLNKIYKSNTRLKDFPAPPFCLSRSDHTPWILKQGGRESSGQRIISSIGKTKKIALFSVFKKKVLDFFEKNRFLEIFLNS